MDKEATIEKVLESDIPDGNAIFSKNELYACMDEFAKSTAIGFAEWIATNGWYFNKIKRWSNRNENSDNLILIIAATKSTEELYSLYCESQITK